MNRPVTPELRKYLLDLVREERSLEQLYRDSHSAEELRTVRAEWKAAYRGIRGALVLEDLRIRNKSPQIRPIAPLRVVHVIPQ